MSESSSASYPIAFGDVNIFSHSNRYVMVFDSGFNLHFLNDK